LQCGYCYEDAQREAGNFGGSYDIEVMKAAIEREGGPFLLFGGEPLLLPKEVLRSLWEWGLNQYGRNLLQTNGTLLDDDHVDLFARYKVSVGISVDGPDELNDARWQGTLEKTRAATRRTQDSITRLCQNGNPPSLIVILHRLNASADVLPRLAAWFRALADLGVRHIGLHLLEEESEAMRTRFGLSIDENVRALLSLRELQRTERQRIEFSLLRDVESLLMGDDSEAKCIWRACDPYTTSSVRGIGGHGERTKCGRTVKDGVNFLRASSQGFERYLALYQTPFEAGGCQGCRFFAMCRGQCPGTAIRGDWRNRSEQCPIWYRVFEQVEKDLLDAGRDPISTSSERARLELELIRNWEAGRNVTMNSILKSDIVSLHSL
jgi:uncharacterized protein